MVEIEGDGAPQPQETKPPQQWPDEFPAHYTGEVPSTGSEGGGGGGGGSGTSTSSTTSDTPYDGPGKDYNDTDPSARFLGIGGHPEVWKTSDGNMYIVYFAQGTEPPVPLLYQVDDEDTLQAFFGEGEKIVYDRELSVEEANSTGAVRFGTTDNLDASEGDPWVGFLDRIERLEEVSPWVNDDEILALIGGAYLENRELQEWELQTTDWWQEHNEQEREWLTLSIGDPSSANRRTEDNKLLVADLFEKVGADGNDQSLIDYMANQYTTGAWSQAYLTEQVEAVTSGWNELDADLDEWMTEGGITAATSEQSYNKVREMWNEWLGPAYQPSESEIRQWATKLRNSGDGEDELANMLRQQRLALFPEYADPNLTWQDISRPWKNMAYQTWGVEADELDPRFQDIVRLNNATEAQKQLRSIGIDEGYERVVTSTVDSLDAGMRRSVRGAV